MICFIDCRYGIGIGVDVGIRIGIGIRVDMVPHAFSCFQFQNDLAVWGVRVPAGFPSAQCCLALAPDMDIALGLGAGAVAVAARKGLVHGVPRRLRQRRRHGWWMRHA